MFCMLNHLKPLQDLLWSFHYHFTQSPKQIMLSLVDIVFILFALNIDIYILELKDEVYFFLKQSLMPMTQSLFKNSMSMMKS